MSDDTARFELQPIMKIEDCEHLHAFLVSATNQNVDIGCSAVERLNGLTAQMLAVAQRSWHRHERQITFSDPSEGFAQGVALLGLSDLIGSDRVTA